MTRPVTTVGLDQVRAALHRLFIAEDAARLRQEDEKKCLELTALLGELSRVPRRALLVDAAAGKSALGLLAACLLGFERLVVLERDPGRVAACEAAARQLPSRCRCEIRLADVAQHDAWPSRPGVVVALHACGPASDAVIDAAVAVEAKRLLLVPCCYGASVPHMSRAKEIADGLGLARHGALRAPLSESLVDAERVLRLESAGYVVQAVRFVSASTTPHNLLLRAALAPEPVAMAQAARRRHAWLGC